MTTRTLFTVALVTSTLACTGPKQYTRLREQMDAYALPKPIAQAWPEALRFVNAHGYELVGADRKVIGGDAQSPWGTFFARGYETRVSGPTWRAETAVNERYERYRIVGTETGESSCRIEFHFIQSDDPLRPGSLDQNEVASRDAQLELAFVATVDPEAAARISRAAGSN